MLERTHLPRRAIVFSFLFFSSIKPSGLSKAKPESLHRFGITAQDIANLRQDARIVELLGILAMYFFSVCLKVTLLC